MKKTCCKIKKGLFAKKADLFVVDGDDDGVTIGILWSLVLKRGESEGERARKQENDEKEKL